jgi:hypothetical protein
MHTKFWSGNLKGKDLSEDLGVKGRIILAWMLGKQNEKFWNSFVQLRIEKSGALL